ncbi:Uncharacterised protein [Bordetella pertussis]|nr:Uncharacterised protein [Bordetella pertussis]CFO80889.1 Uncharacterised protein [Bordetella pertussis]CFU08991.1 Uncharacterised protein [Bordetella pertussis]CFW45971.1 Uncharacterised protein [Bordetella pertussis]CPI80502.1 Uncharacterised protein [Bordetella pertussis]
MPWSSRCSASQNGRLVSPHSPKMCLTPFSWSMRTMASAPLSCVMDLSLVREGCVGKYQCIHDYIHQWISAPQRFCGFAA